MAVLALVMVFSAIGFADAAIISTSDFNTGGDASAITDGTVDGFWTFGSSGGGRTWSYDQNTTTSGSVGPNCPYEGAAYVYTEASSGAAADQWYLTSGTLNLDTYSYTIDFYWDKHHNGTTGCVLEVQLSTDGGSTFPTVLFTTSQDDGAGSTAGNCNTAVDWHYQSVPVTGSGNNNVVRFFASSGSAYQCDTALDLITVDEVANCTDSTPTSATIPGGQTVGGSVDLTSLYTFDNGSGTGSVTGYTIDGSPVTSPWDSTGITGPQAVNFCVEWSDTDCGGQTGSDCNNITVDNTCSEPDAATLTVTTPTSGGTLKINPAILVTVGNENEPDLMANMSITIAGSSACDVDGFMPVRMSGNIPGPLRVAVILQKTRLPLTFRATTRIAVAL